MQVFYDARARLYRAGVHHKEFGQQWSDLLEEEPYHVSVRIDDSGHGGMWVVPRYERMPDLFSFLLGELLYQLRAALDATIYYSAILTSGKDPPPDEQALEFPVCRTPAKWKQSGRKIAPLSDKHRSIVEAVQPCHAADLPEDLRWVPDHLQILSDWARLDRHRRLNVLGSWGGNRHPEVHVPPGTTLKWFTVTGDGFLEHDDQVADFFIDGWEAGMRLEGNPNFTIDVAAREEPPPRDDSDTLSARLIKMHEAVQGVVGLFEDNA